ncbi:ACC synthase [Elsinoe ampelina]|uniref:ACC synthase n=1 Tax=Elsinoe ampelina TaxID=302913 RepID=A0A6A6FZ04_9PEZI|nr:ACC synthase [Elsinoe ampelina]
MALSRRAEIESGNSPRALIWQVYANSYHPESNPDGFINLGVAENRLMHPELISRINRIPTAPEHSLTYGEGPKGSKRLRATLGRFLTQHLRPRRTIEAEHVIITNGVSSAIEHCSWAFTDPGEGWLLGQPHYGAFKSDLTGRFDAELVRVPFGDVDPMSAEAVEWYEKALLNAKERGVKVGALMLCNPHNPLGRCYSKEALKAYLRLCGKHGVHLVSDEVYALSTWQNEESKDAAGFTSILSIDTDGLLDPSFVHVLWGVSKDFGANGLRLGCIVSQDNKSFHDSLTVSTIHSYASGLADHAVAELLEDSKWIEGYVRDNHRRIAEAYQKTTEILNSHGIEYAKGCNAGFFLWVDLGKTWSKKHTIEADEDVTKTIMDRLWKHKVFLASGSSFGSEKPGFFRITFSHPWEYLVAGIERIIEALDMASVVKTRVLSFGDGVENS